MTTRIAGLIALAIVLPVVLFTIVFLVKQAATERELDDCLNGRGTYAGTLNTYLPPNERAENQAEFCEMMLP